MSRQNWSKREFNPSNKPGTCLWCGRALPLWLEGSDKRGIGGDGYFCSIVDGYSWATMVATLGHRIQRKEGA